jgi:DNA repair exonuclease SbcCD ATPase subunit
MSPAEMQDYKRAISELQRDMEKDSAEVRLLLKKLGEYLSYQDTAALPDPAMRERNDRIRDLRRQLPESSQQVKKILQTVAGSEATEREIRSMKIQINELDKLNREIYVSVGRAAFGVYRSLPVSGDRYEELFASLENQEHGVSELEAEQQALQREGKGGKFFKIFRESGRSVYVKRLLSLRRKAVEKSYLEVGKRICASPELKGELEHPRLRETLAAHEANEKKSVTLQGKLDGLLSEQEKRWSELKSLGAHRSHHKRVREIEVEIQRIETRMRDECEALGTLFRNQHSGGLQDSEAASLIRQIQEIEGNSRKKKKRIERLNAAVRIDGLHNQLGNLADRVSRLEGEIESRRAEIETLQAQISEGEKEIQRLQRIRGSRQSLLKEERS